MFSHYPEPLGGDRDTPRALTTVSLVRRSCWNHVCVELYVCFLENDYFNYISAINSNFNPLAKVARPPLFILVFFAYTRYEYPYHRNAAVYYIFRSWPQSSYDTLSCGSLP